MPSSPESGPMRMSTFSFSTSRRASPTALSGVASEQPNFRATGLPATVAPVTWDWGAPPDDLPSAFLIRAYLAPENDSASKRANGPPQVVRTPIVICLPPPPDGAPVVVSPPPPELFFSPPHPAARATTATSAISAIGARPRLESRIHCPIPASLPSDWQTGGDDELCDEALHPESPLIPEVHR